ncbi:MAG TPA: bifunctional hydroxymethylpyrimidine kinase/phosphomethylpyrimidine kinase [Vicinamibacterales bacterium]|jgi:hydroxymethylpyrimidine/phosphomethylpyrimidine kinase|nr:bifunctional hydroxymethylpyrimidine kinase/phosphomethylpyrimidine kinase [Vicinamibacterales bacterium]
MSDTRIALTIAGSDSSGGAGVQADLKTFAALSVYGVSAITAVTAQNTTGVTGVMPVTTDLVTAQIEAVATDFTIHATKIGMLFDAAIVEAVAAAVEALELPLVVVDPVMVAKSGDRLLDDDGVRAMCGELLPRALLVTPNIPEAEVLSGRTIKTIDDVRAAAEIIYGEAGAAVVIKGGHSTADFAPGEPNDVLIDLLFDGHGFTELHTTRFDTAHTHGTGCTFSAAIAARLALGDALVDAVARAQAFVSEAIRQAPGIGHGHGPLEHFWAVRQSARSQDPI